MKPLQYDLMLLNVTELLQLIRHSLGLVIKASTSKERLVSFLYGQVNPTETDLAGTVSSRQILQDFIEKNWSLFGSQLPCKGETRGKCTIHLCPEGRHVDCFDSARPHII